VFKNGTVVSYVYPEVRSVSGMFNKGIAHLRQQAPLRSVESGAEINTNIVEDYDILLTVFDDGGEDDDNDEASFKAGMMEEDDSKALDMEDVVMEDEGQEEAGDNNDNEADSDETNGDFLALVVISMLPKILRLVPEMTVEDNGMPYNNARAQLEADVRDGRAIAVFSHATLEPHIIRRTSRNE
jgi:hypothetical protein